MKLRLLVLAFCGFFMPGCGTLCGNCASEQVRTPRQIALVIFKSILYPAFRLYRHDYPFGCKPLNPMAFVRGEFAAQRGKTARNEPILRRFCGTPERLFAVVCNRGVAA